MLLRRLVAALGPLLLCVLVCAVFRWLDGMIGAASFLAFLLKGALLGAALALTLPLAKGLEFDQVFTVWGRQPEDDLIRQAKYICATRALHELYMYQVVTEKSRDNRE